ncbi:MAG: Zn-dependent hydrolase [Actinobacteria bacterium]|nr:Zn-dependent hydrolase [Actinomycetota bacterium]
MSIERTIEEAARFGKTEDGGVTRLAWEPVLFEVYDWLRGRASECGFYSQIDAAGNLLIAWEEGDGPAVAIGSHLDTVPNGGRFDGALGVLTGFEAMRDLKTAGFQPRKPIWLLAFMDEEGSRFGTSMFGSLACVGQEVGHLGLRTDRDGKTLAQAMEQAGFSLEAVGEAAAVDRISSYLELHIEQGPILERSDAQIGVVRAICGLAGMRVRFSGEANHAGTTPSNLRRDALAGAARFIVALRDEVKKREGCVGTVGMIEVRPGAFNVIPGTVELTVDVRSADAGDLDDLESWVAGSIAMIAREENLEQAVERIHRLEPTAMAPEVVDLLARSTAAEGACFEVMVSGAGHDAMIVGRYVPAGMIFVPSIGGLSHNSQERTKPEDCELGVQIVRRALVELAGGPA